MIRFLSRLESALETAGWWEYSFFTSLFAISVVLMWWVVITAPGPGFGAFLALCALFPTIIVVLCARALPQRLHK